MFSLFLRNLLFTILQPGVVAGVLPFLIVRQRQKVELKLSNAFEYAGACIFVIGFTIMLICIISFAVKGRGTLSPADPTNKLVVSGLYKFSRNPMYVGVLLMLAGEGTFFKSVSLFVYTLLIFVAFTVFIIFFEEPRLTRAFGGEYLQYRTKVPRWL